MTTQRRVKGKTGCAADRYRTRRDDNNSRVGLKNKHTFHQLYTLIIISIMQGSVIAFVQPYHFMISY